MRTAILNQISVSLVSPIRCVSIACVCALLLASLCGLPAAHGQQIKAFPEAEGFGQFATGARTNLAAASVYHVTNLNDSGPGSFRDAVSQSNRFVVFDVGGIANINSVVEVSSNITIAGQTAPGGFALFNDRIVFHGANNLISRHYAVRKGNAGVRDDAASIVRGNNMIFDHMSITWGVDGTFDINPDSGQVIDNITIQDTIVAQGLDRLGHSTGGLMQPGNGGSVSVIRSLWADNVTRNPKVRNENEFINNVVYGWETAAYIMGDTAGTSDANVEGNYFIEGPVNGSSPFSSGTPTFHIYANDNWVDGDRDGQLDGTLITSYPGADVVATRHAFPTTTTMSAQDAVEYVLKNTGVSIVRDAVDTRLTQEVASYGTLGGVIMRDTDLFPGYGTDPGYLNPRARFTDGDNDGIADNWETANGLNPTNGADWKGLSGDGYTWLEEYVNELGAAGTSVASTGGAWTTPATWAGGVPTLADEALASGNMSLASGQAFARRLSFTGPLDVTGGTLDVFDTMTAASSLTISNGVVTAGRVLLGLDRFSGSVAIEVGGTLQTGTVASAVGTPSLTIDGGTFRATGTPNIQVPTTFGAGGATIDTTSYSGSISGAISGPGGLTKQGTGQLAITGPSSYAGPTIVDGGTLRVQTSAALQNSPSIELSAGTTLDVSAVSGGYVAPTGQSIAGAGQVQGNLQLGSGSVLRPEGEFTISDFALGIQAEEMVFGADWAVFNNSVHGTGNGGSYNGAGLNGGGIVLANNQNLTQPAATGLASATVDLPVAGPWYLFVRSVEPSNSGVAGEIVDQVHAGANNSFYASNNSSTLQTTTSNFDSVQTPDSVADVAKWVAVSTSTPPLSGVHAPLDAGIAYNLTAGQKTFAIGGRELGTILDGFVLTTLNLTASQLDATLSSGETLFGSSTGMSVSGDFDQLAGSLLEIGLGEMSQNSLFVGGTAVLDGDLTVDLFDDFTPDAADEFTILLAGILQGEFANAAQGSRISTSDGSGSFLIDYDYTNDVVKLLDFQSGLNGDYNGDGMVNAADYVVWRNNMGTTNELLNDPLGGEIGQLHYDQWRENYGNGTVADAASQGSTVPEPTTLALCFLTMIPLSRFRGA
jgi:autotransporter-associated beta strand protein